VGSPQLHGCGRCLAQGPPVDNPVWADTHLPGALNNREKILSLNTQVEGAQIESQRVKGGKMVSVVGRAWSEPGAQWIR
jgi:hypothetical protein